MGQIVAIMGESGSGKSASMRTFKTGEVAVFEVASKPLPFRNDWKKAGFLFNTSRYDKLYAGFQYIVKKEKPKSIVIDDAQYLMAFENFANAKVIGYGKYTDMAVHYQQLLKYCAEELPDDFVVYVMTHVSKDDDGHIHIKTLGKMLDNQLTVDGLFTTVLYAFKKDGGYYFATNECDDAPNTTAKSPIGMFDRKVIPNDLALVDRTIRNYYKEGAIQ